MYAQRIIEIRQSRAGSFKNQIDQTWILWKLWITWDNLAVYLNSDSTIKSSKLQIVPYNNDFNEQNKMK